MEISPDAEDLALKMLGQYAEHLRSESERIASLSGADRISTFYVEQAATSLRVKRHVTRFPEALSSIGLVLSGTAIGLTAAVLMSDGIQPAGPLISAAVTGASGLGLLAAGVGLHLWLRER